MFAGCDVKHAPVEVDPDLTFDETPVYSESESDYPYDHARYQAVLDGSKLQYPHDNAAVEYGQFANYKSEGFYSDAEGRLYFTVPKEPETLKTRSELREQLEWTTNDETGHYWVARLKVLKPKVGITSYTWMQIHGTNDSYNYPILRLLWSRNRSGQYDHLWAVVIVTTPEEEKRDYTYVDLGPRPDDFFDAEVHIFNNRMTILINRVEKDFRDIGYWQDVQNYFKAGVYINRYNDGGEVTAIYEKLDFFSDPSQVVSPHH